VFGRGAFSLENAYRAGAGIFLIATVILAIENDAMRTPVIAAACEGCAVVGAVFLFLALRRQRASFLFQLSRQPKEAASFRKWLRVLAIGGGMALTGLAAMIAMLWLVPTKQLGIFAHIPAILFLIGMIVIACSAGVVLMRFLLHLRGRYFD
jgi:hypothetical protein